MLAEGVPLMALEASSSGNLIPGFGGDFLNAFVFFDFEFAHGQFQFNFTLDQLFRLCLILPCKNENNPIGFIIMQRFDMDNYTFRLKPGDDIFDSIESFVRGKKIEAGCVLSGVGSLTRAVLRLANRDHYSEYKGHFEIVSLTGTVSIHGSHLHVSISDGDGKTIGGHLVSGCKIYTTAEIVLAVFNDVVYKRELLANDSGYAELVVQKR
jgi:hypothetical protein